MPDEPFPIPHVPPEDFTHLWRRCRVYVWTLFLGAGIIAAGVSDYVLRLRESPILVVRQVFASLPYPSHIGSVEWADNNTLVLRNVSIGSANPDTPAEGQKVFFRIGRLTLVGSMDGLINRRLDVLKLEHPQFFLNRLDAYQASQAPVSSDAQATTMKVLDWAVREVVISQGTIFLENIGPGRNLNIPIQIGIDKDHPTILRNVHLNDLNAGDAGIQEQRVQITDISLVSPFDPLTPVLNLPLTEVSFTYGGLWHRHLKSVSFVRPTLYLGADLFWFVDGSSSPSDPTNPRPPPIVPWTVDEVGASYGGLGVCAFGQPAVSYPFTFDFSTKNIRTDHLDQISLKTSVPIRRFSREYPSYKVKVTDLYGDLAFNLPPGDQLFQNAVQTLNIKEVSWNDLAINEIKTTIVFTNFGILGALQGSCYKGAIKGNFGITYDPGFPWTISLQAQGVDVAPITQRLAPNYLLISGKATGNLTVTGKAIEILTSDGSLTMAAPGGVMQLGSLQELLEKYPIQGNQVKQAAAQYLVTSLKEYHYQKGTIDLKYTPGLGIGKLHLDGPLGLRDFSIYWHPFDKQPPPTSAPLPTLLNEPAQNDLPAPAGDSLLPSLPPLHPSERSIQHSSKRS